MTRRELLTRRYSFPGLPRYELEAKLDEAHRRSGSPLSRREWLDEEVEEDQ